MIETIIGIVGLLLLFSISGWQVLVVIATTIFIPLKENLEYRKRR